VDVERLLAQPAVRQGGPARVRAYGRQHRITFGTNHEGWSEGRARVELDKILRQIQRGTWEPPALLAPAADERRASDETFHAFASGWWSEKEDTLTDSARVDYRWRLDHLLGFFHRYPLRAIDRRAVDGYRAAKLAERRSLDEAWRLHRAGKAERPRRKPLSNRSIIMTIDLLAQILDAALDTDTSRPIQPAAAGVDCRPSGCGGAFWSRTW
jgi:hypothetical protein